jgi:hypothetical protein
MRDRYPYLAHWKKRGFEKFPSIPPEVLRKAKIEVPKNAFREGVREGLRKRELGLSDFEKTRIAEALGFDVAYLFPKDLEDNNPLVRVLTDCEDFITALYEPTIEQNAVTKMQDEMNAVKKKKGEFVDQARKRIMTGEDYENVLRELGRELLPKTKGGGTTLTENGKRILKRLYLEMQDCIKEVRRRLMIPLKSIPDDEIAHWDSIGNIPGTIKQEIPEISTIFTDKELSPLVKGKPIADTAAMIILNRLKKHSCRLQITTRRFQDILSEVPPF